MNNLNVSSFSLLVPSARSRPSYARGPSNANKASSNLNQNGQSENIPVSKAVQDAKKADGMCMLYL